MIFKHIFSTGYLAEVEIDTSSPGRTFLQTALIVTKLKDANKYPTVELLEWVNHINKEAAHPAYKFLN